MAQEFHKIGHKTHVFDADQYPKGLNIQGFDGVIVGGSVHFNGYSSSLKKWAAKNLESINQNKQKPSAFYSVCLGILQKDQKKQIEEYNNVNNFISRYNWQPTRWKIFAGSLSYSKYSWPMKNIMRLMAFMVGADTDTGRDYVYTNWKEVRAFVHEFASLISIAA